MCSFVTEKGTYATTIQHDDDK